MLTDEELDAYEEAAKSSPEHFYRADVCRIIDALRESERLRVSTATALKTRHDELTREAEASGSRSKARQLRERAAGVSDAIVVIVAAGLGGSEPV